jgi:O-antigen ligase
VGSFAATDTFIVNVPIAVRSEAPRPAAKPVAVGLARLWAVVVFSNLPIYIGLFVFPPIVPLHWLVVLFALSAFTLSRADRCTRDRAPVFVATLMCYAGMCLVWYVSQGGGEPNVLRERMLGLAVCLGSYLVFAASAPALLAARRALAFMVIVCVLVNMWDITHPYMLVPSTSELATVGRAAGFFINPNQAGAALVTGFALSVSVVPRRWRFLYLAAVALGVGLTFSRAAILGLALVSFGLAFGGRSLTWRQIAAALLIVGALTAIAWLLVSAELQERFNIDPEVALDRVLWIFDPSGRSDYSQEERIQLLERGWEQFLSSPLVGNGVGSTELWEARSSTHNMYVMLASDFGIIGLLIFPCIVLAAMGTGAARLTDATVAGLFLLFWGLFSHNVLSEYYLLLTISMVAALSRRESVMTYHGARDPPSALPAT